MPGPGDRGGKKERPRDARGTLRRIAGYLTAYRWPVLAFLLCSFLSNAGNLLGPPVSYTHLRAHETSV